jgi:hypothetical protein
MAMRKMFPIAGSEPDNFTASVIAYSKGQQNSTRGLYPTIGLAAETETKILLNAIQVYRLLLQYIRTPSERDSGVQIAAPVYSDTF